MMLTDVIEYDVLCLLKEEGHITDEELALVKFDTDLQVITDDIDSVVDVCENGDVSISNRGAYPLVLKGFVSKAVKLT